jgi:large subunit ribosomal protein L17
MRHRTKHRSFGRQKDHQKALAKNLITSFLLYEKMKTTEAKAKSIVPKVEKLITLAKNVQTGKMSKMNGIRELNKSVFDENASKKLLEEIAKRYTDRSSGFTRLTHLGPRAGDAAPMVLIELV